jgi:hypothetical protein
MEFMSNGNSALYSVETLVQCDGDNEAAMPMTALRKMAERSKYWSQWERFVEE